VLGLGLLAAAGAGAALILVRRGARDQEPVAGVRFQLAERHVADGSPLAGDPEHGRELYAVHCAPCHGARGDGQSPTATYLWPLPRDHTDGGYMNSRSDEELYRAISGGGSAVNRSALMPAWNDRFDSFEIWNLVAYIRTLHGPLPEGTNKATYHEVVLSESRSATIATELSVRLVGEDHRVVFLGCYDKEERLFALAVYPSVLVEGQAIRLVVFLKPDAMVDRAWTNRQIALEGQPPDAVDRFLTTWKPVHAHRDLCEVLASAVHKSTLQVAAALEEEKEDLAEADSTYEAFTKDPRSFPRGQRLYIEGCANCHGVTGRVVGPRVTRGEFRPRNHADGSFMNRLSDEYLRSVIRYGGYHWNISGSMPATSSYSADELTSLVEFLRSIATPSGGGRCPCGMLAMSCGNETQDRGCACANGQDSIRLCTKILR